MKIFILTLMFIVIVTVTYNIAYLSGREEGDRQGYRRCLKQRKV